MKTMNELVKELVETEKLANVDLEAWDWRTRPSMTSTVRDAQERLADLKKTYFARVSEMTLGVFVFGSHAAEWAAISEAENGGIVIHADAIYNRIADMVEPVVVDSKEFSTTAMTKLIEGMANTGREFGVSAFNMPKFRGGPIANRAALVDHIRNIIRDTLGDDLTRMSVTRELQRKIYEKKFDGNAVALPIVVIGLSDAEEAESLESAFNKFGAKVNADEVPTVESVLEVFASIKKRLFKNKK